MKKRALYVLFGPEENDRSVRLEDTVDYSKHTHLGILNPLVWWKVNSLDLVNALIFLHNNYS